MAETPNQQKTLRETAWHVREADEVISELDTDPERGLSQGESEERLERYGPNEIRSGEAVSWWQLVLRQFKDPLIYLLIAAAIVSVLIQEVMDATLIMAVVVLNAVIGFYQESRAVKAIRSLAEMTAPKAHVIRDGEEHEIPSRKIVFGDLVVLAAGRRVPADVRLVRVDDLKADESALTGESEPVSKQQEPVEDERAVPGDQLSMAFAGTNITRGRGCGVVVRTGDASELGQIAEATREIGEIQTPIKEKTERLGKAIGAGIAFLALVVIGSGLALGMELHDLVRTAVAMAVAAIPEGLPVVLTVALAVGVQRMAKRNAIIRSLPAVETLGSATVVGSDKTGTLTANQMTVKVIWAGGQRHEVTGSGYDTNGEITLEEGEEEVADAVRMTTLAGLLANEAKRLPVEASEEDDSDDRDAGGDPTEVALLVSAMKSGYELGDTREQYEEVDMIPFESDRQFMATLNETPRGRCIFLKGSPEAVLERCSKQLGPDGEEESLDAEDAGEVAGRLADEGYRVLGMAYRYGDRNAFEDHDPGSDLVFAGFQAMQDPVRPGAIDAVRAAQEAGLRVIMLTGDHVRTARSIGRTLGLLDEDGRAEEGRRIEGASEEDLDEIVRNVNVFARVSPHHKLDLVNRLKEQGHIVAVTGDGVNDAPALQAAHLGIAMGQAGTDVAREASDMVLADDNFASITKAIEEGRIVFANIRKVTYFLISTAAAEVLAILTSFAGPWPLIWVPAQVLWVNLVTNGVQDLALAFEKGEPNLLEEPPRDPKEGVLNRTVLWRVAWLGLLMGAATIGVFWWMLRQDVPLELARSVAMTQMVLFECFHVLNSRSFHRSVFKIPLRDNPFLAIALPGAVLAHIGVLYLPFMQRIFETAPLALEHWALVVGVGLLVIVAAEADKAFLVRPAHEKRVREGERQRKERRSSAEEEESA
ncbi:MAG: cation-translocating P-type ATPase [Thermoanaerobaculia bacterium]